MYNAFTDVAKAKMENVQSRSLNAIQVLDILNDLGYSVRSHGEIVNAWRRHRRIFATELHCGRFMIILAESNNQNAICDVFSSITQLEDILSKIILGFRYEAIDRMILIDLEAFSKSVCIFSPILETYWELLKEMYPLVAQTSYLSKYTDLLGRFFRMMLIEHTDQSMLLQYDKGPTFDVKDFLTRHLTN